MRSEVHDVLAVSKYLWESELAEVVHLIDLLFGMMNDDVGRLGHDRQIALGDDARDLDNARLLV
jgi:hypothetical protein